MIWSRLRRTILAATLLVAGAGPTRAADYIVPEAVLRFPDRLGGFILERGARAPYAQLGHIIHYKGVDLTATVYVYDGGRRPIPDGARNPVVQAEFEQVQRDILAAAHARGWPPPVKQAEAVMRDTAIEFLTATYRVESPSRRDDIVVAISGARAHYVKVRITIPAGGDQVDAGVFLRHVGALVTGTRQQLRRQRPPRRSCQARRGSRRGASRVSCASTSATLRANRPMTRSTSSYPRSCAPCRDR